MTGSNEIIRRHYEPGTELRPQNANLRSQKASEDCEPARTSGRQKEKDNCRKCGKGQKLLIGSGFKNGRSKTTVKGEAQTTTNPIVSRIMAFLRRDVFPSAVWLAVDTLIMSQ